jgi:hypothetical protein
MAGKEIDVLALGGGRLHETDLGPRIVAGGLGGGLFRGDAEGKLRLVNSKRDISTYKLEKGKATI